MKTDCTHPTSQKQGALLKALMVTFNSLKVWITISALTSDTGIADVNIGAMITAEGNWLRATGWPNGILIRQCLKNPCS